MKTMENNMPEKIKISFDAEDKPEFEGLIRQFMYEHGYWKTGRIYYSKDNTRELIFEKTD